MDDSFFMFELLQKTAFLGLVCWFCCGPTAATLKGISRAVVCWVFNFLFGLGFIVFLGCLDPFSPDSLLYLGLHRRPSSLFELGLPGRPSSLLELGLPRTRGPDSLLVLGLHRSPSSLLELGLPGRPSSLLWLGLHRRRGSSRRFGCLEDRAALV